MSVQPYLFFDGRCDEAIEFYKKAVGAEVSMLMRYKDSPQPCDPKMGPPPPPNGVMHANLRVGGSTILCSDGCGSGQASFKGFGLSLIVSDVARAERAFAALGEGGRVEAPLTKTFFSPSFGMVFDRFGVMWMVYVGQE